MIRNLIGVVAGYIAIMVAVFVLLTGAYLLFGTERAFEPGSYKPSMAWCLTMLVLGVPAALLGGWLCARIGGSPKAVVALAVLVLVLGVLMALPALSAQPNPGPRPANVPNMEAMMKAQTPPWVAFLNPVIGLGGVLLGGRRRTPLSAASTSQVAGQPV